MEECKFVDLGYMGYEFTCSNNWGRKANIQERLDSFLANELWKAQFVGLFVSHLPKKNLIMFL